MVKFHGLESDIWTYFMSPINNIKKHSSQCTRFLLSKADAFWVFFLINSKKRYFAICWVDAIRHYGSCVKDHSFFRFIPFTTILLRQRKITDLHATHINIYMCVFSKDYAWEWSSKTTLSAFFRQFEYNNFCNRSNISNTGFISAFMVCKSVCLYKSQKLLWFSLNPEAG